MSDPVRTVLIVDDDPQILRLVEKMLKPRQVRVLIAPRAADALRICEQEPVHVLISDVAMPEMDGNKLADRVLRLYPHASVLLISGHYKELPEVTSGRLRYLRKPFFPSDLIQQLREMLPE
jgi:DNA-binding NtrC family response regulator